MFCSSLLSEFSTPRYNLCLAEGLPFLVCFLFLFLFLFLFGVMFGYLFIHRYVCMYVRSDGRCGLDPLALSLSIYLGLLCSALVWSGLAWSLI